MRNTIQRTIHYTKVKALAYNEVKDTNEVINAEFIGTLTEKLVSKKLILAGFNVIKIKSVEYIDELREMSQETFVEHSTPAKAEITD